MVVAEHSRLHRHGGRALNYVAQLRPYSFADLVLLVVAVGGTAVDFTGVALLRLGFLVHLEWRHRDRGRLRWHWSVWAFAWIAGAAILWQAYLPVAVFAVLATAYTLKKRWRAVGYASWLINGGLKTALIATIPSVTVSELALVMALMSVRNLAGDFRDAEKDAAEGVRSFPVLVGYHGRAPLVYLAALAATTITWTVVGHLPWWAAAAALVVEAATYPLTPR